VESEEGKGSGNRRRTTGNRNKLLSLEEGGVAPVSKKKKGFRCSGLGNGGWGRNTPGVTV